MLKNYLLVAWRNMKRNKGYFFIHVIGLSVGLAATLLAFVFVLDELSYDQFHGKKDRIYRLNKVVTEADGSTTLTSESSGLMGPTMRDEFPEIEEIVRYEPWFDEVLLYRDDQNVFVNEGDFAFADSTFFKVFDFRLLKGDAATALGRPATVVITREVAQVLFGDEDPIGKKITGFGSTELEVTGIIESAPRNSHIQFAAVASWGTSEQLGFSFMNNWIAQALVTYLVLKEGADPKHLEAKFPNFMQRHMPTRVDRYHLYLQPFNDLYLGSTHMFSRMQKQGSKEFIYLLCVVALFVLAIACINYINISTSKATRRGLEVGLRKTLGARQRQLMQQFLGESILVTSMAGLLALLITDISIPFFNELAGRSLEAGLLLDWKVMAGLLALIVVVALVSGAYPALILASFKPVAVLKSSTQNRLSGHWPRYVLIAFQFVMSIMMIAGALLVNDQIQYVLSKDLGFNKDQIIVVPLTPGLQRNPLGFAERVRSFSSVEQVSVCRDVLGGGHSSTMVVPEGMTENLETKMFRVDGHYQETFGIRMAEGRFFDYRLASDSNAFLVNQSFVDHAGWENPLQHTIRFEGDTVNYSVIGVMEDFHFSSLKSAVEPLIMWIDSRAFNMAIRYHGSETSTLLAFLEQEWKARENRYPFTYRFVDDQFASMYQSEQKLFRTIFVFAILSILIACLGLYGLVSFTLEQRTKEIGIRKVLGATVSDIAMMVNKQFAWLVMVAAVIAVPATIYIGSGWLNSFAFHTELNEMVFVFAVAATLMITILAVSIQSIRAATSNPVKSLRQE